MILLILILYFAFFSLGLMVGVYIERKEWNKLIDEGIINKPTLRKK
jgi:uncharacterized protein YneF (UPF0154 family)